MVRIITDSAADFEPDELKHMNITCVPLTVILGEKEYQENINLTKQQFYTLLEQTTDFPRTSQPSPEAFADACRQAKENGEEAVVITLSSGLSGTYQSAVLGKTLSEHQECYVVDSLNGTGGVRVLVEYAVQLRDQGKTAKEIAQAVEELRHRVVLYCCMDTLEYLHRGGRISHTTYRIGSMANIKPILHVDPQGRAEIPSKTIGLRRGIDYLCKRLAQTPPDPNHPLYVMFTQNRANGEVLAKRLEKMGYPIPPERIIPVGAAIGTHIGPNACAIVYLAADPAAKG